MEFTDDDIEIEKRIGELIDRGLECYGAGDMEGALGQWKHALALDPDNERAANYLEYVEEHHDLGGDPETANGPSTVELDYPFGVSTLGLAKLTEQELEDYESFEILENAPGASKTRDTIEMATSVDDGWNVDEAWVQGLVAKSEASYTPVPPDDTPEQAEIATVDLALSEPEGDDEENATRVHRTSEKMRSSSGFEELELHPAEEEEEEEPTRMRLDSTSMSGSRGATHFSEELELELDEDEEHTSFHDSPNRVGVAHDAAKRSDIADLELGGLGDIAIDEGDDTIPPLASTIDDAIADLESSSPPMALSRGGTILELEIPDSEPGDDEQTMQLDLSSLTRDTMDMDATKQHFAIDDELTVDRGMFERRPRAPRAPTQDHGISPSSIQVDETLLSLQDSTRELDLGDMGLALRGDAQQEEGDDDEYEVEISLPEPTPPPQTDPETQPSSFAGPGGPTEATDGGIMGVITREAPEGDSGARINYIVNRLIEHGADEFTEGHEAEAASAVCKALDYASDSAVAQKVIFENERRLVQILIASLGDASQVPQLTCPLTDIPPEHIDHRAAFLLTRLDQAMTLDELLDVSGMPRLEALRHLCGLHVLGFLAVA